ncbi:MAG: DHH family phosphoesterase, partial [Planctomycetota bacterium]
MKIFLIGSGPKVAEICESLSGRKDELFIISSDVRAHQDVLHKRAFQACTDPATFDFAALEKPPADEDIIVVAEPDQERLRAVLDHLLESEIRGKILAFTPMHEKKIMRSYPDIVFKSDRDIFRKELRDLARRDATVRRVNQLRAIVREKPKLLILIWGNPDPDALAAADALRELVREDVKDIAIAFTGEFSRNPNKAMSKILKIHATKFRPEMVTRDTTVATVDAQPSFFELDGGLPFDIAIDHHPAAEEEAARFSDIRPDYGSTASILTEYFLHTKRTIPKQIATGLYLGLKVDTDNLSRNVTDADVAAFGHLRNLADEGSLRLIELSQMPMSVLDHFAYAITHKKMAKNMAFCYLGTIDNPDTCVHIADFLVKVEEIAWTMVACRSGDRVTVVFRS